MLKALLCILLIFSSLPLQAGGPQLGDGSSALIQGLLDKGITKIGDFDVAQFLADKRKIQWALTNKALPADLTGGRKSAYYLSTEKKVFVAATLPDYTYDSLSELELHEALGALGYMDRTYMFSSSLKVLSEVKDPAQLKALIKTYGKEIFNKASLRDSGTSVGGGGDVIALTAKQQTLTTLIHQRMPTLDFLRAYPQINFEPNYEKDQQEVAIDYRVEVIGNQYRELITLFVPALLWQQDEASREAIVNEMLDYVLSVFPAYPNSETVTYVPSGCSANTKVTFPKALNGIMKQIQEMRGSILHGCGAVMSMSITFPYFRPKK